MQQQYYIDAFSNGLLRAFRFINKDELRICIYGLEGFIDKENQCYAHLFEILGEYNIKVSINGYDDVLSSVQVRYSISSIEDSFSYQVSALSSLIRLSADSGLPLGALLIIRIVGFIIAQQKTLFKAIILDLDDTLWPGTIAEDGLEVIKDNLARFGHEHIAFMKYVKALSEELGIYVAICSRNDASEVNEAISGLDENLFPLKNQIDYIIANDNSKGDNVRLIVEQLSILSNSVVFIDDNRIARDDVRQHIPEVYVPEWNNHHELVSLLQISGLFDRTELSLRAKQRKEQLRIIQAEKAINTLPELDLYCFSDHNHKEAIALYKKSNQFKFSNHIPEESDESEKSICFELYKGDDNLGVCATLTYSLNDELFTINNWALSCRFFTIGLEEAIILYILSLANTNKVLFKYQDSGKNLKASELINKYSFIQTKPGYYELSITEDMKAMLAMNTNIIFHVNE